MNPDIIAALIHRNLRAVTSHPPNAGDLIRNCVTELEAMGAKPEVVKSWKACIAWYIAGWSDAFYAANDRPSDDEVIKTYEDWKGKL